MSMLNRSSVSQSPASRRSPIMFEWNCSRTAMSRCMTAVPSSPTEQPDHVDKRRVGEHVEGA